MGQGSGSVYKDSFIKTTVFHGVYHRIILWICNLQSQSQITRYAPHSRKSPPYISVQRATKFNMSLAFSNWSPSLSKCLNTSFKQTALSVSLLKSLLPPAAYDLQNWRRKNQQSQGDLPAWPGKKCLKILFWPLQPRLNPDCALIKCSRVAPFRGASSTFLTLCCSTEGSKTVSETVQKTMHMFQTKEAHTQQSKKHRETFKFDKMT